MHYITFIYDNLYSKYMENVIHYNYAYKDLYMLHIIYPIE